MLTRAQARLSKQAIKQVAYFIAFHFLLLVPLTGLTQQKNFKFQHIGTNEGLSQGIVHSIIRDSKGFMWIATRDGLNKYDGYEFTIYKNEPNDKESIISDFVNDLLEDKQGNLWIATSMGLERYNRKKEVFEHYQYDSLPLFIRDLYQDSKGNIWLGAREGLVLFKPEQKSFTIFQHDENNPNSISHNTIQGISEGEDGILWIGTQKGLNLFNPETKVFTAFKNDPADPNSILENQIKCVFRDSKENIWIATQGTGVSLYDSKKKTFTTFRHIPDKNSISYDYPYTFEEDAKGNIWIGTEGGGLNVYNYQNNSFTCLKNDPNDIHSISLNSIRCLYKDDVGNMWVGTASAGINFLPKVGDKFMHYRQNSLNNGVIKAIYEDRDGNLWIGNEERGVDFLNRKSGKFTHYRHNPLNKNSLSNDYIFSIAEVDQDHIAIGYRRGGFDLLNRKSGKITHHLAAADNPSKLYNVTVTKMLPQKDGTIWLGTWGDGLILYNLKNDSLIQYKRRSENEGTVISNNILTLNQDRQGNLWVGTDKGLDIFDIKTKEFAHYTHKPENKNSISNNLAQSILEDSKGNVWIGTDGGGLNLYHKETDDFTAFTEKDGLPNNVVYGILEDESGNLWLSTNRGIAKFNPQTKNFRTFKISDGLQAKEFKRGAYFKGAKGEMFFGGINGVNSFFPESMEENLYLPPVSLTNLQIFNKPVKIGEKDSPLLAHISETKELTLPYFLSVFTLEYAALNFTQSGSNQYAYKLEGFDKEWNFVGTQRRATYTNLDPGKYTFRVKASNNDGKWNEEGAALGILITPPFWKTWWFRALVLLFISGTTATFFRVRVNTIKKQKAQLEQQVKDRTQEVVRQKEELESQATHLQSANNELKEKQEEILQQQEEMMAQAEMLTDTNENLRKSQKEIAIQRDNLKKINEQVMSSIRYAQTIQKAILPSQQKIQQVFPEHFILYRPKDVVSGDFYWFTHLSKEDSGLAADLSFLAVVDCTGHGVPGAFMSIIGSTLLNEIVNQKQITDPAHILEQLHEGVKQAVEKTEGVNTAGMDVCLCQFEIGEGRQVKVLFSGAKRNLLFVKKGGEKIEKLLADRRSIGSNSSILFQTQELILEKGSMLYLSSDGYADQNNPAREKMGTASLYELIQKHVDLTADQQLSAFEAALDTHQQNSQQRDDITLLGLRI